MYSQEQTSEWQESANVLCCWAQLQLAENKLRLGCDGIGYDLSFHCGGGTDDDDDDV